MKIRIAGNQIQEMASSEILDHIPASAYKRIKAQDGKPEFRAYVIAHEGESEGKVVGIGKVIKKWARSAISNINDRLALGTSIFHLHEMTNDHEGRKPIGEVVGKALSDVAGKLSSLAFMYIYPEYRDIPLDIASIEADITMPENINPNARAVDVDVEDITAIALGNSQTNKPGFAGAALVATLQEFADSASREKPNQGDKSMTKEELKQAIRDAKLKPSDIFGSDEIADDPTVQGVIRDRRRNEEGFGRRMEEKLEAEKKDLQAKISDLEAKLSDKDSRLLKTKATDAIKPAIERRKLDEKQTAFVMRNASKFDPKSEESLAGDLDRFLDAQLDEYKTNAEIFGVKLGEPAAAGVGAGRATDKTLADELTPDALKDEPKQ
jgi:hypothetical protein